MKLYKAGVPGDRPCRHGKDMQTNANHCTPGLHQVWVLGNKIFKK